MNIGLSAWSAPSQSNARLCSNVQCSALRLVAQASSGFGTVDLTSTQGFFAHHSLILAHLVRSSFSPLLLCSPTVNPFILSISSFINSKACHSGAPPPCSRHLLGTTKVCVTVTASIVDQTQTATKRLESPSFLALHHHGRQEGSQPVRPLSSNFHKSNASTASRSRSVRPPSLKDISDRLTSSPTPSALSEITGSTNLPSSDSRLKLPPSAVARANLAPSPPRTVKKDENDRVTNDKTTMDGKEGKNVDDVKPESSVFKSLSRQSSVATLKNSETGDDASNRTHTSNSLALSIGDDYDSPTPSPSASALPKDDNKADTSSSEAKPVGVYKPKQLDELPHQQARASLGRGFPGLTLGPETPARLKEDVPSIIVQRSTPGQSPGKVAGGGVRSGSASPALPSSPRSLANGIPLQHAWWVAASGWNDH